jgi:hypothetical protein
VRSKARIVGWLHSRVRSGGGRRLTAYAGLLALLVQALLPLSDALYHARIDASHAAVGKSASLASATSSDASADGQQGGGDEDSNDPHKGVHLLGAGLLPTLALIASALVFFAGFVPVWRDRLLPARRAVSARARAPPVPV